MLKDKQRNFKKVLSVSIIIILVFAVVSIGTTKAVYDSVFPSYKPLDTVLPQALEEFDKTKTEAQFISCGNLLKGYMFAASDNSKDRLLIMAEGLNSTYEDYIWQVFEFTQKGYGVFIFDTTGYGDSEGESAVGFSQQLLDLDAALDFIAENQNFGYDDLFLLGHSRGGYSACCVLDYGHDITAVVSISGINSAMEGVIMPAEKYVGGIVYSNYPLLWLYQVGLFGKDAVNASAVEILEKSGVPALVIHGDNDETVPEDKFSIASYAEKINSENITFMLDYSFDGNSGHTNILFDKDGKANGELIEIITDFFDTAVQKTAENGEV